MKKVLSILFALILILSLSPQTQAANVISKDVANQTPAIKSPAKKPAVKSPVKSPTKKPAVKTPVKKPVVKKPAIKSPPIVTSTGSLKGSVTWQYNNYVGTKADVGAKVFLIPKGFKHANYTELDLELFAIIGSVPKGSNLHFAKVNGFGSYEINDVPVGEYLIIISSKNTTRDLDESIDFQNVLEPIIGTKNYPTFELFNLKSKKHEWKNIEIKKDKTIDVSHDFGNTYF